MTATEVSAPARAAPVARRARGMSIRFSYIVWFLLFAGLWFSLLWLSASLSTDQATLGSRLLAAAQITAVVSVAAFLPILLLYSFFRSERQRAQEAALTEADSNGWTNEFRGEINEWYARVFDEGRYPIPATLALLTFLAGWLFLFFHDGPAVTELIAPGAGMNAIALQVAEGPPLSYGILGSYFFAVWFLFRRYISGDLGPGAFLHVAVRTWLVAILTLALAQLLGRSAVTTEATSNITDAAIAAAAFTGAFIPTALLNKIRDMSRAVLSLGNKTEREIPVTVLMGMNPWKAARLAEEGIDNIQNLAMDQPSRLFVTTREGGLRILDWMDQAILYNAATDDVREGLAKLGIRTSYDLFLAMITHDLVERVADVGQAGAYRVGLPNQEQFPGVDPTTLRYVAVGIVHHPTFENVRQMRERALRTAAGRFPMETLTMKPRESTVAVESDMVALRKELLPCVLLVERPGLGPVASAALVGDRLAVTTLDVGDQAVQFRAAGSADGPAEAIAGTLVAADPTTHLGLYRLAKRVGRVASLASRDPAPGDILQKQSHISGAQEGPVDAAVRRVDIVAGDGNLQLQNVLQVRIPSAGGEAGAPLFDANGDLAAIAIAGSPDATIAMPTSRLPSVPGPAPEPDLEPEPVAAGATNGKDGG